MQTKWWASDFDSAKAVIWELPCNSWVWHAMPCHALIVTLEFEICCFHVLIYVTSAKKSFGVPQGTALVPLILSVICAVSHTKISIEFYFIFPYYPDNTRLYHLVQLNDHFIIKTCPSSEMLVISIKNRHSKLFYCSSKMLSKLSCSWLNLTQQRREESHCKDFLDWLDYQYVILCYCFNLDWNKEILH